MQRPSDKGRTEKPVANDIIEKNIIEIKKAIVVAHKFGAREVLLDEVLSTEDVRELLRLNSFPDEDKNINEMLRGKFGRDFSYSLSAEGPKISWISSELSPDNFLV